MDWPPSQHDFDFEFLGLVALADPTRAEVPAALAQCRGAGVRVILMTGDHPATALAIARQVGLSERAEVITGEEMAALDDGELSRRLAKIDICAQLRPEHKLRLVRLLRAAGEAAALVLLDDSFSRIVEAIRQGRRIYDNIRKATVFVFAVHVPVIALTLLPSLLHWPALLGPLHIVVLQLLIDPACSLVFEAEAEEGELMERPPRPPTDSPFAMNRLLPALLQGAGLAALLLAVQAWMRFSGWEAGHSRSVVFCVLVLDVMLLILASRGGGRSSRLSWRGGNPWLWRMALAMVLLLAGVLSWPWLRELLGLAVPTQEVLVAIGGLTAFSQFWLEVLRCLLRG